MRALVDTGSTDCELRQSSIDELRLAPLPGESVRFETAAGIEVDAALYQAIVRIPSVAREALCLLSPAEKSGDDEDGGSDGVDGDDDDDDSDDGGGDDDDDEFGLGEISDDALLGHDALAALGLAVDCRRRALVVLPTVPLERDT